MTVINASAAATLALTLAAALALMTVITQWLLMDKINFHSFLRGHTQGKCFVFFSHVFK